MRPFPSSFLLQIALANGHSVEMGGPIDVVSSRVEQLAQLPGSVGKVGCYAQVTHAHTQTHARTFAHTCTSLGMQKEGKHVG